MNRSELTIACEQHGISITSEHIRLEWEDPQYPMDVWDCTLHYNGKSVTFPFKTGIGHRVLAHGWKVEGQKKWYNNHGGSAFTYKDAIAKGALVIKRKMNRDTKRNELVGPDVASVVRSYLDESQACSTTFDDWCSSYGANNDSLKALNTYINCQREGMKFIRLLGSKLVEELMEKQD